MYSLRKVRLPLFLLLSLFIIQLSTMQSSAADPTPTATQTPTLAATITAVAEERPDLEKFFKEKKLTGSFTFYDYKANKFIRYNPKRSKQQFIPASTYKIMNSLVGLETGVVTDENFTLKWDGTHYQFPSWNHDQTLQSAITNSVVWYYQEVARRIGRTRMQHYIDAVGYGNQDISGPIDLFWLEGSLRISPEEQIMLLIRLYKGDLPFSKRTMDIVKKILINERTDTYILRAKTGSGTRVTPMVGWWVGYVEENDNAYFFATTIESDSTDILLSSDKIDITRNILKSFGLLESK